METTAPNNSQQAQIAQRFKTPPLKHQLACLNKFGRREYFALLAEQGTGKTWIIINDVADLWSSGDCDALLVLAPNGVHTNWTRVSDLAPGELQKHMPEWVRWRGADWVSGANKSELRAIESLYDNSDSSELRIFAMNWDSLQTKAGVEAAQRFCNTSRRLMIACDESDNIKNPQAIRTKALMKLKKFSHYRRIMTGTPYNNAPFDFFSQYMFLDETILGTTSYSSFKAEYAEMLPPHHGLLQHIIEKKTRMAPEVRQQLKEMIERVKTILQANGRADLIIKICEIAEHAEQPDYEGILRGNEELRELFAPGNSAKKNECLRIMQGIDGIIANQLKKVSNAYNPKRLPQIVDKDKKGRKKFKNLDKLSALIAPHSFRVLKKDCLDLPEKVYKTLSFRLTDEQQRVYDKAKEECRIELNGVDTPFTRLVAATKLSQITSGYYNHPMADEPVRIAGENPKLDLLAERVQSIVDAGEKVIIWARYTVQIEDISKRLKADGHKVVEYYGKTNKAERTASIEQFEDGDADVFLGNQQAGGSGITLIAASHVIYFSNNFRLRDRLQSEDRAHRIGQDKSVTYTNIVAENTVDEYVVFALDEKIDVADVILNNSSKIFT
jgi:SNF2 family DNA or RNA helicase